ncbi:hypothetical protein IWX90DRAFT_220720 [Phyllosticta citrichinensis]|uniref:Uncharacterized protein n=1 Tax=Phyllosticta citrichinensis TaxID=1130410 RepID=A0ABR1XTV2_9PEZI
MHMPVWIVIPADRLRQIREQKKSKQRWVWVLCFFPPSHYSISTAPSLLGSSTVWAVILYSITEMTGGRENVCERQQRVSCFPKPLPSSILLSLFCSALEISCGSLIPLHCPKCGRKAYDAVSLPRQFSLSSNHLLSPDISLEPERREQTEMSDLYCQRACGYLTRDASLYMKASPAGTHAVWWSYLLQRPFCAMLNTATLTICFVHSPSTS